MFKSLTNQYLIQTPDYHLITQKADCLSGCVSGIAPVLDLDQRVLVNKTIVPLNLVSNSPTTKHYILGAMVAVPLEVG